MKSLAKYYLKVLRPGNLLLIMSAQFLIKWLVFDRFYFQFNIQPVFSLPDFFFLSVVTLIITGAGNLVNDIYDWETDQQNPAKVPIVKTHIRVESAWRYYGILVAAGAVIAAGLAWKLNFWKYLFIYPLAHLFLFIYSKFLKMTPLAGNLVVALFIGGACLVLWLAEYESYLQLQSISPGSSKIQAQLIIGFSCLAFVINFTREIVKDMEDYFADKSAGLPTTAVYFGLTKCRNIALSALLLSFTFLFLWQFIISPEVGFRAFWFFQLVFIPAFACIILLFLRKKGAQNYGLVSSCLKYLQLLGLLYIALINL